MMLSAPALTAALPGKASQGGGAAREDPRPEVEAGIARYRASISPGLIRGAGGGRAGAGPRGCRAPEAAAGREGSGLRAPGPGLLCAGFQLNGCCSSLKLK